MGDIGINMTVRQIYYQLVSKHLIENSLKGYKNYNRILTQARKENLIDPFKIVDTSKPVLIPSSWDNLGEFIQDVRESYKKKIWTLQNNYVEVWLEKDALRGVFKPITDKYDVPLLIGRGYQSFTNLMLGVRRLKNLQDKTINILYFGDFDPTGLDIPRNIQETLFENGINFEFYRLAITQEQIREYNIPPILTKKTDSRARGFIDRFGDEAVELDALNPKVLREMIESSILKYLDDEQYQESLQQEKEDITKIQQFLEKYGGDNNGL